MVRLKGAGQMGTAVLMLERQYSKLTATVAAAVGLKANKLVD